MKKIALFFLISLHLLAAFVDATLDKIGAVSGEVVTLTIKAEGNNIEFPLINKIAGFRVVGTSTSQSISIINGKVSKSILKSFQFIPTKTGDFEIEQFSIKIDGKIYKTPKLNLKVFPPQISKNGDTFVFEIKIDKSKVYVGEPIILEYIFKYRVGANILDLDLDDFKESNFWVKKDKFIKPFIKNGYVTQIQRYVIFPQISGKFSLSSRYISIATRDGFGFIRWKKIYSNKLNLVVKDLPNGVNLVGKFKIKAKVDKPKAKVNEPINLTLEIGGIGNIEDIDKFDIKLDNVISYSSKPEIKTFVKNNKFGGIFRQKISFLAENNFTIPPFKLKYFDKDLNKTKIISTKPIKITIIGAKKNQINKIITAQPKTKVKIKYIEKNSYLKYIYFAIGFVLGMILMALFLKKGKKDKKEELPITKKIKKAKNDKELYNILLPYINDENVKEVIKKLEKNIYGSNKEKIDKREIIEIFEED